MTPSRAAWRRGRTVLLAACLPVAVVHMAPSLLSALRSITLAAATAAAACGRLPGMAADGAAADLCVALPA